MRVCKVEKITCNFCLDVLARRRIKPNDAAFTVPARLLCLLLNVFEIVAEVAMS